MPAETTFRVLLTLPSDQAQLLSNVAKRLGSSQSALVSILLAETLPSLSVGLLLHPDASSPPRRLGGPHMDQLRDLVVAALREGARAEQLDIFGQ